MSSPARFIENIDGAPLAIYEVNPQATRTALLVHGNSISSHIWTEVMHHPSLRDMRLVAFDFAGHGKSDKAHAPEQVYTVKGMVDTLNHVVNKLELHGAAVVANSLGAHIVMNNVYSPDLFSRAICFGYPPLQSVSDFFSVIGPSPAYGVLYNPEWSAEECALVAREMCSENGFSTITAQALAVADPNFRIHFSASMQQGLVQNEWETIRAFSSPVVLLHGTADRMIRAEYFQTIDLSNLTGQAVQMVKGGSHLLSLDQPESIVQALLQQ